MGAPGGHPLGIPHVSAWADPSVDNGGCATLYIYIENKDPVAPWGGGGVCVFKAGGPTAGPPMVPKGLLVPKAITYYFHSLFPERHLLDQTG